MLPIDALAASHKTAKVVMSLTGNPLEAYFGRHTARYIVLLHRE
jgi:hypothetical protein